MLTDEQRHGDQWLVSHWSPPNSQREWGAYNPNYEVRRRARTRVCSWPQRCPDDCWNELFTPVDVSPLHHYLLLPSTSSYSSACVTFSSISLTLFMVLVPSNQNSLVKATHPSCTRLVCVWACERVARGAQRDFISALKHVCATALLHRATLGDGVG